MSGTTIARLEELKSESSHQLALTPSICCAQVLLTQKVG